MALFIRLTAGSKLEKAKRPAEDGKVAQAELSTIPVQN